MRLPNVVRGSSAYIAASVVQRGALFAMLPFATRAMSPDEFGRVGIAMSVVALLTFLCTLGLETAVIRAWYRCDGDEERQREVAGTAGVLLLSGSVLLSVLTLGFVWLLDWPFVTPWTWTLIVASAESLAVLTALPLALLPAQERLREYLLVTGVQAGGVVSGTAVLVLVVEGGATGWVAGATLGNVAGLAIAARLLPWPRMTLGSAKTRRRLTSEGLPMVPHLAGQWGLQLSDRIVGTHVLTLSQVAVYSLAFNLVIPLTVIATGISQGMQPLFARSATQPGAVPGLQRALRGQILAIGLFSGLLAGFGPACVDLVFPDAYAPAVEIMPILAIGTALWATYSIPMNTLSLFIGRPARMWILTLSILLLKVAFVLLVVPDGDLVLLTWTFVGANALLVAGTFGLARRDARARDLIGLRRLFHPALTAAVFVGSVAWAAQIDPIAGLAATLIASLLYAGVGFRLLRSTEPTAR